jgi:protein TonB
MDGIEGYVVLEYTVDETGKVRDIVVLQETPKGYGFARSAIKAAEKFRYKPRVVNGQAVPTTGIREKFEYKFQEEG